jgi:1,4-alpha-glucan branching enzyme
VIAGSQEAIEVNVQLVDLVRRKFLALSVQGVLSLALLVSLLAPASAQVVLQDGVGRAGEVAADGWVHYAFDVYDVNAEMSIEYRQVGERGGPPATTAAMYVRHGAQPTAKAYDFLDDALSMREQHWFHDTTSPKLKSGRYHVSIYGAKGATKFRIVARRITRKSFRGGMGALPFDGGAAFRVWAPFAQSVHVAGDFNNWHSFNTPLVSEGNGNWSVDLRNALPGQKYRYVIRRDGQENWRADPREEEVTNSVGDSVIFDNRFNWTDQGFQMPNWNEMVIYELHIGTFHDSPGWGPGNFESAIDKLDYLADLGVNAVKVMPVSEFAGDFSWGYNPAFPFAVEKAYGGPYGFKRFVNEAHRRGIAVLLDVVHNHYGPSDLGLWRFDGWSNDRFGGVYFYQDGRADTPWGSTRPDYGRAEVRQYIRDNILMWVEEFHVDGFRWDSTVNIRRHNGGDLPEGWSLMQWINDEINAREPWVINIAEDLQSDPWLVRPSYAGGAGFDSQWDANFVHPVREVIVGSGDNERDMEKIRWAINFGYSGDAFQRVIYTESHDETANGRARVPEEIWPGNAGSWFSRKRSTLGAALVMTAPGIPMLFQGQEFVEDGWFQDSDPVDWSKAQTYGGIRRMYQDLIRLRRNWYNQTRGLRGHEKNVFHVNNNAKVVAFHRWQNGGPGDDVIVICNFRDQAFHNYRIGLPRGGLWRVRFNSDWQGYSSDFGNFFSPDVTGDQFGWDGMPFSGTVSIAPYSVLILSQD